MEILAAVARFVTFQVCFARFLSIEKLQILKIGKIELSLEIFLNFCRFFFEILVLF